MFKNAKGTADEKKAREAFNKIYEESIFSGKIFTLDGYFSIRETLEASFGGPAKITRAEREAFDALDKMKGELSKVELLDDVQAETLQLNLSVILVE